MARTQYKNHQSSTEVEKQTHKQNKNQSTGTDIETTQMIEKTDLGNNTLIVNILHIFKKVDKKT